MKKMTKIEQDIERFFATNGKTRIRLEKINGNIKTVIVECLKLAPVQKDLSSASWETLRSADGETWEKAFANLVGII